MDLQKLLLEVGKALQADEVRSLAFLCTDILGRNPALVESASDLFSRLVDLDLLSAERPGLLRELLLIIQRLRLVRDLKLPEQDSPGANVISPYRKLLYELSEQITSENLKDIKFLLYNKLPRKCLMAENVTTLDVFLQMERKDLLSDSDLKELEILIQDVCPMLKGKIQRFKAQQAPHLIVAQAESRPRSLTDPPDPHQFGSSLLKSKSSQEFEHSAATLQPHMTHSSSYTSLDLVEGRDQCEILTHSLSSLWTNSECSSALTARCEALERIPAQENQTREVRNSQTTNTHTEDLSSYPMTSTKRGVCLIVNNHDFTESRGSVRNGTMVDEASLVAVFQWLGFEVQTHTDCDRTEMLSLLRQLGSRDHSQMDCVVCCVLSHGKEGSVCGVDDSVVGIKELMEPFDGLSCPTLVDKPKMFFIQACQGAREQKPVAIESDASDEFRVFESDAVRVIRESIPAGADFLLGMSTVPSYVSFRTKSGGSWFIQSLCQNLIQMVPRGWDLVSILTKVNADVSLKSGPDGTRKQMPQPAFSLRKRVVFPVPSAPPPRMTHLPTDRRQII